MKNLKIESGRSMVEMLGVLAIIGVLSVGGVAGYKTAMQSHIANEINNNLKVAMVEYGSMECGTEKNIKFSDTMTASIRKGCGEGFNYNENCQNVVVLKVKTDYLDKSSLIKISQNMYDLKNPYDNEGNKEEYLFNSSISGKKSLWCYSGSIDSCKKDGHYGSDYNGETIDQGVEANSQGIISIEISNCS